MVYFNEGVVDAYSVVCQHAGVKAWHILISETHVQFRHCACSLYVYGLFCHTRFFMPSAGCSESRKNS